MEKVLVLGASKHTYRYSYLAAERLTEHGHEVILVGTTGGEIFGQPIRRELPMDIAYDTVTMYLSERNQQEYIEPLLKLMPKRIIFNPGAENDDLYSRAKNLGIEVLNACTLVMLASNQF